ncbi:YycH family regulatory protein [Pediococcus stilesii]|uniref:Regulatory protein YycH domain-containing protein n=1 Tax=Pediococcus stilesii TaxID=331679 RepID=A0A0R2L046_9LACO|nr:two-component system activity regulator YycH [Pediococcus stilesii]KRN95022.1 hypothetical protein IV81_GL000812 [Pediococcus stilesii]TLQ05097.1 hypothetical protein FEZ51_02325 [Pediococcus stilesii]
MKDTKTRKIARHVILALLALASMALSWIIWTNPARYERAKQVSTEKVQSNQVSRDMSDVILPTQVIYTNSNQKQTLINSSKKSLSKAIINELSKWKLESSTRVSRGNKERFLDYASMTRSLMLKYPSNVTGQILSSVYDQKMDTNTEVSQIVINLDRKNEFFLLDDKTYDVYQIKVTKQSLKSLRKIVKNNDQEYGVKEKIMNHKLINDYPDSIEVPYYSFLINKESSSVFTANLLTDTDADSIDTKKVKDGTEYVTANNAKRLLIQNDGSATFNDTSKNNGKNGDLKTNIEKSFYQMKQLGVQVDNMRYFNFHPSQYQAEFRDYVGGFPIFNNDGLGTIKVSRQSSELTTAFSIYNLDVPVPTSENNKELPSTETILNQLELNGIDTKKIEDIDVGYDWSGKVSANSTVELEPTWYIKYRGDWTSYRDLIS